MPGQATSRTELCDVVIELIDQRGLDALSIRAVAGAAGVAIGTVQHHLSTKDELLRAAYERVVELARQRVQRAVPDGGPVRERVRALLEQLLPLDATRRAEVRVALAFSARAMHAPPLGELYAQGYVELRTRLEDLLVEAVGSGQAAPGVDARRDAAGLAALADGLAWHLLAAPAHLDPGQAGDTLERALERLLPARDAR